MASINLNFYKKSYMLEFMKNGTVDSVFTFSVPPENEQFDFSQRVVETKTFGGSVFENFGNDTIRITLSGSTGNGEAKLIYRGSGKTPNYLTGENEIWELQKQLQDWHDVSTSDTSTEKKIYLYDLSKMSTLELAAMSPSGRNWWRVIIKNFQIKRQVSKPIYYNYTLELLGLVEESHAEESLLKSISDAVNSVASAVDTVNDYVNLASDVISTVNKSIETVKEICERFKDVNSFSSFMLALGGSIDTVNRSLNINTNTSFYSSTQSCLSSCTTLYNTVADLFDDDDDDDDTSSTTTSSSSSSSSDEDTEDTDSSDTDSTGDSTDDTDTSGSGSSDTGDTDGSDTGTDSDSTDDTGSTGSGDSTDDTDTSGDDSSDTGSTGGDSTDDTDTDSNTDTDTDSNTDGSDTGGSTDTSGSTGSDSGDDDTTDTGDDSTDTGDTGDETDSSGSSTLSDGTYTASYTGDADELGEVAVTVESGEAVSVSVDGTECTASEGVWLYMVDTSTVYAITLATGAGLVTYTYETVLDTSTDE